MNLNPTHNPIAKALSVNAALLAAILLVLVVRNSPMNFPAILPAASGQVQQTIAGGAGVFIMPGQLSSNTWGCYLMDIDSQTLLAYQFQPGEKQLRLIAARNFKYDRRLGNYNTTPAPLEVQDLVKKEGDVSRIRGGDLTPTSPEAPKSE